MTGSVDEKQVIEITLNIELDEAIQLHKCMENLNFTGPQRFKSLLKFMITEGEKLR